MNDHAIATRGLVKRYDRQAAVNGLEMRVPTGAVYGFLGRNGAGKSTTIKMLMGLAKPDAGSASVLGLDCATESIDILRRVAFVGENKTLYDDLTPEEMVRFTRGFYPRWSAAAAEVCARRLDVPMRQRFKTLSKGNRAKVWLLLAVGQAADLLVLDEPTAGLDAVTQDAVLQLLADNDGGRTSTVFFSSHDLAEVERICDWVGIVDAGRMLVEARLDDIREHYRLVIAEGRDLPMERAAPVESATRSGSFSRYLVSRDADAFAARLRSLGAVVTEVIPLSLRDVFLELVRKEDPCTSGNAGATLEARSLASSRP
jgi:ABC-2 type transport system ATP-binding protein